MCGLCAIGVRTTHQASCLCLQTNAAYQYLDSATLELLEGRSSEVFSCLTCCLRNLRAHSWQIDWAGNSSDSRRKRGYAVQRRRAVAGSPAPKDHTPVGVDDRVPRPRRCSTGRAAKACPAVRWSLHNASLGCWHIEGRIEACRHVRSGRAAMSPILAMSSERNESVMGTTDPSGMRTCVHRFKSISGAPFTVGGGSLVGGGWWVVGGGCQLGR